MADYVIAVITLGVLALLIALTIHLSHNINMGRKYKKRKDEKK